MKKEQLEAKVARNTTLIEVFEKRFDKMEELLSNHISDMSKTVMNIEKNLDKKPSWTIALVLTMMASIIVGLITFMSQQ